MRLETFSYLPPFTEAELVRQVEHLLAQGLVPMIEHAGEPRDRLWTMWKLPLLASPGPPEVIAELHACATAHPDSYVRLIGYDGRRQQQVVAFVACRPARA